MATQLNIKDAEAIRLARKLADQTGQSVTAVIREALVQHDLQRTAEIAERKRQINDAIDEFRRQMPPELLGKTSKELFDALYDADGLPI